MRDLHFGYDRDIQAALWEVLGPNHWGSDLNITFSIPYAERPASSTGSVLTSPVDRRAVVIEGDMDLVRELLGDDFDARRVAIFERLAGGSEGRTVEVDNSAPSGLPASAGVRKTRRPATGKHHKGSN